MKVRRSPRLPYFSVCHHWPLSRCLLMSFNVRRRCSPTILNTSIVAICEGHVFRQILGNSRWQRLAAARVLGSSWSKISWILKELRSDRCQSQVHSNQQYGLRVRTSQVSRSSYKERTSASKGAKVSHQYTPYMRTKMYRS